MGRAQRGPKTVCPPSLQTHLTLRATHINTGRVIWQAHLDVLMSCLPQDFDSAPACTVPVLKSNIFDAHHRIDRKQARARQQNVLPRRGAVLVRIPLDLDNPPAFLNHICRTRLASCGFVRLALNGAKYGGCRGGNNQPPCRAKPQDVQKPLNTNYKLFKGPFYTPIYHLKSGF